MLKGIQGFRQQEYEIVMQLSEHFSIKRLCRIAEVSRSGFYKWRERMKHPSERVKTFVNNTLLFKEYHEKYPSHGYRWLNAKIRLDTGQIMSDPYAYKCCRSLGIKSVSKHYRYRKPGNPYRLYPNLTLADMDVRGPMQCIVSDMTAFYIHSTYYELTLYMDIWNNEIVSYGLSAKRGDRMTYMEGLKDLLDLKKKCPDIETVLHTDQGSVYASKSFNEILPAWNIKRSMSRAGTPTDNAAMESINGWMKAELFTDMHVTGERPIKDEIKDYIKFFNEERPAYALGYLTPKQYREQYA